MAECKSRKRTASPARHDDDDDDDDDQDAKHTPLLPPLPGGAGSDADESNAAPGRSPSPELPPMSPEVGPPLPACKDSLALALCPENKGGVRPLDPATLPAAELAARRVLVFAYYMDCEYDPEVKSAPMRVFVREWAALWSLGSRQRIISVVRNSRKEFYTLGVRLGLFDPLTAEEHRANGAHPSEDSDGCPWPVCTDNDIQCISEQRTLSLLDPTDQFLLIVGVKLQ